MMALAVSLVLQCVCCAEQATAPAATDPALCVELVGRKDDDQKARGEIVAWMQSHGGEGNLDLESLTAEDRASFETLEQRLLKIDADNTAWLKQLVDKQGWPTISQVGKPGAAAAWILVQHADADPKFQRRCLDLMTALAQDEVLADKLAYLTDRVRLAEGQKQLYGTQVIVSEGRYQPRPIEDEAQVDQRRAKVGLEPLSEYLRSIEAFYGPPRQ